MRARVRGSLAVLVAVGALAALPLGTQPASATTDPGKATTISGGGTHSCAITPAERLKCWGYNQYGQLGIGEDLSSQYTPVLVPNLDHVKKVATGKDNTCAIVGGAGKLKCWGFGLNGVVGDGLESTTLSPVVTIASGVAQVDVGDQHACAVLTTGAVQCWGNNPTGAIGDGTNANMYLAPTDVTGITDAIRVSVGHEHSCAVTRTGAALCWGLNESGTLGDGTYTNRYVPTQVVGLDTGVTAISAGDSHTCAVVNGAAQCWGSDSTGQLGDGTAGGTTATPSDVLGMTSGVTSVKAGASFTCGLKGDRAKCWGLNDLAQLGSGDHTDLSTPATVKTLRRNVAKVDVGSYHGCAVLTTGTAKCWGYNGEGQVGTGIFETDYPTPQTVLL